MIYFLINSLYNYAEEMEKQFGLEMTANGYWFFIVAQIVSTLAIFIVFYTFRSIGLYKMAEKKGMEKPWLAVLPFSALYITSALAPKSKYIKTYKNLFVYAIVFKALAIVCSLACDLIYGIRPLGELFSGVTPNKFLLADYNPLSNVLYLLYSLFDIVYIIISIMLYNNIFKAYTTKKAQSYFIWSVLVYVFAGTLMLAGIFIFVLRNNERVDYDAYIGEKIRRQQAYRNAQYGQGPYGNPYNGYGRPPYGGNPYWGNPNGGNPNAGYQNNQNQNAPDPFEEFSNGQDNSTTSSNTDDDLFN